MKYEFVKDASGNCTGVTMEMELWNYINFSNPSLAEYLGDLPYQSNTSNSMFNFISGEPIPINDFDTSGQEN